MSVSFYDFKNLHHDQFRQEIKERIGKIIDDGAFVEGEYNKKFEADFAKLQESKYCRLVANGTDALEIALLAYDIKAGDLVGVPGITFYATAEAVLNVGAIPILIDVEPNTGLMSPASLERLLKTHDIKAIMPVHIYGLPAPIKELEEICQPRNIKIIEDAAQAQGTFLSEKPVGATNNLVTFSFYPTKNLSAFGDAGCILTQDETLMKKIEVIRNHGRGDDMALGRNSRCDHIQAAVLDLKLEQVVEFNNNRKKVASWYHEALQDLDVGLVPNEMIPQSSWHLYPIHLKSVDERQKVQAHLKEMGIGSAPFYEKSLNQEGPLSSLSGEWEIAEKLAGTTLCLPIHPFISKEDVEKVVSELKKVL